MERDVLMVRMGLALKAQNGGLFVSRGQGRHPDRRIASHELIFVRKGILAIQEEERRFEVSAGQSLLLWPKRRHWGTAPFPPDLAFYWVHFTLQGVPSHASPPDLTVSQHVALSRPDHMTELFRRFLDDQESGALDANSASLLVMLMLCEVARSRSAGDVRESASTRLAGRADAYIRTHFHEPITPSGVAESLGCNANYLSRIFREVYGQTLTEAIQRRRLHFARQLLLDDDRNVDEIARVCGFSEAGYFRRLFKRQEGVTPLAFRRLYSRLHTNTH
ncbi:MAG TPA: AraC family transcriptional regulator [Chthonomonadaceae bacterium]|nr:AraC family transcriptional regulator [Chthonomonadaceae bacterium]